MMDKKELWEAMKNPAPQVDKRGHKRWKNRDGNHHRTDGPAVIYANGGKDWCLNGKLHRTDGPAVERPNGRKEWYLNGKRHRVDGPAKEYTDGTKQWWLNNKKYTEQEHAERAAQLLVGDVVSNELATALRSIDKAVLKIHPNRNFFAIKLDNGYWLAPGKKCRRGRNVGITYALYKASAEDFPVWGFYVWKTKVLCEKPPLPTFAEMIEAAEAKLPSNIRVD